MTQETKPKHGETWWVYDNGSSENKPAIVEWWNSIEPYLTPIARVLMPYEVAEKDAEIAIYKEALEKLSRLGNGDCLGNSDGNLIAQAALMRATEKEK